MKTTGAKHGVSASFRCPALLSPPRMPQTVVRAALVFLLRALRFLADTQKAGTTSLGCSGLLPHACLIFVAPEQKTRKKKGNRLAHIAPFHAGSRAKSVVSGKAVPSPLHVSRRFLRRAAATTEG